MNNAKFRMVRLCELMHESTPELLDESRLASDLAVEWDTMYEKFVHLLSIYQKNLESRMPPKDKMGKKRRNELFHRYFENAKLLKPLQGSLQF